MPDFKITSVDQEVQTRDGRSAKIAYIRSDAYKGDYPILVLIGEQENLQSYTIDGKLWKTEPSENDLVPKRREIVKYINMYRGSGGSVYFGQPRDSRSCADAAGMNTTNRRIACHRMVAVEGKFDE